MSWFVLQLGARENYAIARAIDRPGKLDALITDNWHPRPPACAPLLGKRYTKKIAERFSPELAAANVTAFNLSSLRFELIQRVRGLKGWPLIIRRNQWFQKRVVDWLRPKLTPEHTVFAYSYAAKQIFELAREVGCRTILGQIDPGLHEENLVAEEVARLGNIDTGFQRAPSHYWDDWKSECDLASVIMVNSQWSQRALELSGIDSSKIDVVPLVYSPPISSEPFHRQYPDSFSEERPLRVLYLGQIIPRKGIQYLISAAKRLADQPVRFTVVGNPGAWQSQLECLSNIQITGNVPRSRVDEYYQDADLFLFPTLSDGFGLTQLEAQHWRLPMICSKSCGQVVRDGETGFLLDSVSTEKIVHHIQSCLSRPKILNEFSTAIVDSPFGLDDLAQRLRELSESCGPNESKQSNCY